MKSNQRIIRILIALTLVIFTTFSMTSCFLFDFGIYEDMFEEGFGSENNGGDGGENDAPPNNNNQNQGNNNQGSSDNIGEFYPGSGQGSTENVSPLKQTLLSTVIIISEFGTSAGAGSGVIYKVDKSSGDAYIITNQHVVYSGDYGVSNNIRVYLYGMELDSYAMTATFVGGSVTYDIAVLKISGSEVIKNSFAKAVSLGKSSEVRVFDTVYAVGNPEAYGFSVTQGIVSVRTENVDLEGADGSGISLRVMRIDAAVNHGNSGGGLYDENGRLIGIVAAKTQGDDIDNMGYAIPIDLVKNVADNILYYCDGKNNTKLNRALVGITITAYVKGVVVNPESGDIIEKELVEVSEVSSTGIANGKIQVGDIVNSITVDGVKVDATQVYTVPEHMLTARIGSIVILNITRGGTAIDITFNITPDCVTATK